MASLFVRIGTLFATVGARRCEIRSRNSSSYHEHEDFTMGKRTTGIAMRTPRKLWAEHREGTRNWLALGLLLAAWNASDDGASRTVASRPASLRGYSSVTVRAAQRCAAIHP
jgi:hypothetical protein